MLVRQCVRSTHATAGSTSSASLRLSLDSPFDQDLSQVSDDDLLEVLGQSRDPMAVQKHIKKCFEGFKAMEVIAPGKQLNRNFEVMISAC